MAYKQQVALGEAPDLPTPNERMHRTGVGDALSDFAREGLQLVAKLKGEDATANATHAVSETNLAMEEAFQKAKENAQPGAPEFTPGILDAYDKEVERRATALPDELTRKAYRERMTASRDNFGIRSLHWEADERRRNRVTQFSKTIDNDASALFAADGASRDVVYQAQQDQFSQSLDMMELEPAAKDALREEAFNKRSFAAVQGDLRDRPDKVQDWLVKGSGSSYFAMLRAAESGGRNIGSATSSAFGPYQFTAGTWKGLIGKHADLGLTEADRINPEKQEIAIRAFTADNAAALKSAGLPATDVNLYMMHFLGEGGGPKMVRALATNPQDDARLHVTPGQASANASIFNGRSVEQVFKLFGGKFGDKETWAQVSDAPKYYGDIPFAKRDMLYGQAEQEMNKRRVQGEAAFKQRVDNSISEYASAGAAAGAPTEQEFVSAMGALRGTQAYGEFQANSIAAEASYRVQRMPLAEGAQYVESLKPKQGDPFYAEKQRGYAQAREVSDRIRNSALSDFGQHVVTFNGQAKQALSDAMSSQDAAAAKAGAETYTRLLDTEARRLGVPASGRSFLPKSYSAQIAATLDQKLTKDADAAGVVNDLNAFKARWGDQWPRVYGEMKDTMSPTLQVVTSGVQPRAAMTLVSVHGQSFDQLAQLLPKDQKSEIVTELQSAFEDFTKTTMWQQSSLPTLTNFYEQGKKLAAVYMAQGQDAETAATAAYNDILGAKYQMIDAEAVNVRIPKANYFPEMESVLRFERREMIKSRVGANKNDPAAKVDQAAADKLMQREYIDDSIWVTLPDESGVALMRGKELRNDKFGQPMTRTWAEINAAKDRYNAMVKRDFDADTGMPRESYWEDQ